MPAIQPPANAQATRAALDVQGQQAPAHRGEPRFGPVRARRAHQHHGL
jgi:hypothetical protein